MSDAIKKNAVKTTQIDGDVSVGRNVSMGGDATVQGKGHFKGNVRIDGWLEARNIKGENKGLFLTLDALKAAYPFPQKGWYALVGDSLPADVYVVQNDKWVSSGGKGGDPSLDLDSVYNKLDIDNKFEGQTQQINALIEKTDTFKETLDTFKEESENLQTGIGELKKSITFINVDEQFPLNSGFYTAETARNAISPDVRTKNMVITYHTSASIVIVEQFTGLTVKDWETASNWETISPKMKLNPLTEQQFDQLVTKDSQTVYLTFEEE
ncbi:MAG: hypothetical protein NC344_05605 [Bacteroidales bacterium]|nr:hypothetical protein [Bacteroidales bacterium]MCM1147295.1 hypothetical protein [Bacteroidales bacterium]MCM1206271.1 hypothetical protein [Bacillota bacterium]